MKRISKITILLILMTPLFAQGADKPISSPSEFLGYELGDRFTLHHHLVAYIEHVSQSSPLAQIEYYGESHELRPLLVTYVSSEANLARIDEIRENNLRRAGILDGNPTNEHIAIVWLSYNIHGNESSSLEAAMQTLYDLVDPQNTRTKAWLENTLVIIDPTLNPDGRDRYATWFNQTVGRHFNPQVIAREHVEPWPGGRPNHYLFDLNRDWAWQTQLESRHRNTIYQRWLPHVHADFHEMFGNRYYFAPGAEPFHESITTWQREFQTTIGRNHARYFEEEHELYYTRESFDLFYPSYGDTWPTYQGAIGMTYEQSGHGRAGLGIITNEGDTLTLKDRIANHHRVGLSTIEVTAQHHQRVSEEFGRFYNDSRNNPPTKYKSFVLRPDGNNDNMKALLSLLDAQQISYGRAPARRNISAFNYETGKDERISVSDNDIVVSMYQPKSILAHILMEPRTTIIDSLTYDITAWSLPYVYGVQAFATTERLNPSGNAHDLLETMQIMGFPSNIYAYLFKWNSFEDARFLAALHQHGIRTRIASKPLNLEGGQFAPGSIVVTINGNQQFGEELDGIIRRLSSEYNRIPVAISSGFARSGVDLGSESVAFAKAPSVLTFSGDGVSSLAFGEVWHFFDELLEYPLTIADLSYVDRVDFTDFDVIVLPQGNYSDLLSSTGFDKLHAWISAGGRLIALDGVMNQLKGKRGLESIVSKIPENVDDDVDTQLPRFGDRQRESMRNSLAGAIYRVNLDNSHPLGFGYADHYYTLKRSSAAYEYLDRGWNVGYIPKDGHVSGFVGHKLKPLLTESFNVGTIPIGRGQVILFNDNPLFRGFWYNGRLLFVNAVFQPM